MSELPSNLFDGLDDEIARLMGDKIRKPDLYDLGNPFTGDVEIELKDSEMPGYVWIHPHSTDNTVIAGLPDEESNQDKQTFSRALMLPNIIPKDLMIYGTPVYVHEVDGVLNVTDLGGVAAAEYLYGLKNRPQKSIDISQFDYGLLRPTAPPSAKILMSAFRPVLDNVAYDVPALMSIDLIAAYGFMSIGLAKAIKIEVDPVGAALHYTPGSTFPNTTHKLAFNLYYPKTVTAGRYLLGWVKLYEGMQTIEVTDLYVAQDIYGKDSLSGLNILRSIMTIAGEVLTSNGQVMWSS